MENPFEWTRIAFEAGSFIIGVVVLARSIGNKIDAGTVLLQARIEAVRAEGEVGREKLYEHLNVLYTPRGELTVEFRRIDHAVQENAAQIADVAGRLGCPATDRRRVAT